MFDRSSVSLAGRKGLVTGIANDQSIAWGCAKAFRFLGADLAVTYLGEKAKPHVEPLARELEAEILAPLDLRQEGQLEALFARDRAALGPARLPPALDRLRAARGPARPRGRLLARRASCRPWTSPAGRSSAWPSSPSRSWTEGGALFCMTYYGSQVVVEHYNMMGPVKAALESATRYMAAELGPKGIRVHAISPGPLKTRAASGIAEFDELLDQAQAKAPMQRLVSIDDVGLATAYLATDAAKLLTGQTLYIDGGYSIID